MFFSGVDSAIVNIQAFAAKFFARVFVFYLKQFNVLNCLIVITKFS